MSFDFVIEPLNKKHDRSAFDCGEDSLNEFLKKFARQNAEKDLGKTFVAVLPGESKICGFYTLSTGSVSFEIVPAKLPRYPIPTAHLGRLAVDNSMKGQGLGELLLIDALRRTAQAAREIAIYAIEVFALNDSAKQFYLKYGFAELADDQHHLYLPMETIRKLEFE